VRALRGLGDMPLRARSKPPTNGMDSVSRGLVFLKSDSPGTSETPHCVHHGAMLQVGPVIRRGIECLSALWSFRGDVKG
jgi:hypothetical protein